VLESAWKEEKMVRGKKNRRNPIMQEKSKGIKFGRRGEGGFVGVGQAMTESKVRLAKKGKTDTRSKTIETKLSRRLDSSQKGETEVPT